MPEGFFIAGFQMKTKMLYIRTDVSLLAHRATHVKHSFGGNYAKILL